MLVKEICKFLIKQKQKTTKKNEFKINVFAKLNMENSGKYARNVCMNL
jgi:hypothetical protein